MVTYEWTLEIIEDEEISDSDFSDSLSFDKSDLPGNHLGLVMNEGNEKEGLQNRFWAYVKDGKLPECFEDGSGQEVSIKVPDKFHKQLYKYLNN